MAENLLSTEWYRTKAGVQNVVSNYGANLQFSQEVALSDILFKRLEQLKQLYEAVLDSEKRFYNNFRIIQNKNDPDQALSTLQAHVEIWNNSGARKLVSSSAHETVLKILTNPNYRTITIDELKDTVNLLFSPGGELVSIGEELTVDRILDTINEELKAMELSQFRKPTTKGQKKEVFWIEVTNGQIKIDGNISPDKKKRIRLAIQNIIDKKFANTSNKPKNLVSGDAERNTEMLKEVLLDGISVPQVRACIEKELSPQQIIKYNLAKDYGVIKGFLGEVYWNALFRYLGAVTIPVGDEKDKTSGASIAIDLLINSFGFQVKNFNFNPEVGKIQFGTRGSTKDVGTFITKRVGLNETDPLGSLLLGLYGAYGFNQDYSNGSFSDTRQQLEDLINGGLDETFSYFIDRIIRLDAEQEAAILKNTEAFMPQEKTLFNSFFLIADKIVPSSQILLAIINEITNTREFQRMRFETTKVVIKDNAITHQSIRNNENGFSWNLLKMANQVQIGYKIELDINQILARAYQQTLKI